MNKTILVIGIIFLFVMLSFTSISGNQINNQFVKPTDRGSILYVGGSGEGNYSTIEDAIENASDGDTVFVYDDSSPYYENITIDKSINLIGEDKNTTVIDGERGGTVIRINADFVTISGFRIIRGGYHESSYGIFNSGQNTIITGNIISNNHYGVVLAGGDNFSLLKDNIITDNNRGIRIASNNTIIEGNYIDEAIIGIRGYGYWNITQIYYYNNTIVNNTILSCVTGISLMTIKRTIIVGNIIKNNLDGIFFWGCDRCIISNNLISNHLRFGINLFLSSKNQIKYNNFIGNLWNANFEDFFIYPPPFVNLWFRNYWDRPRLLPKPIFGKLGLLHIPLYFPWIEFDMLPAEEPYYITTPHGCGIE